MRLGSSLSGISSPLLQRLLSAAASHEVRPSLSGLQPQTHVRNGEPARAWAFAGTLHCCLSCLTYEHNYRHGVKP